MRQSNCGYSRRKLENGADRFYLIGGTHNEGKYIEKACSSFLLAFIYCIDSLFRFGTGISVYR